MKIQFKMASIGLVLMLGALLVSCTKMYTITTPLEEAVPSGLAAYVGDIEDNLPSEVKTRPTLEEIDAFRASIAEQMRKEKVFIGDSAGAQYTVRGNLSNYKKGSGALRFFIGFGAGNAYVETHLELVDNNAGAVVFAGDFKGQVSDWTENGAKMFDKVAKDFAKQLAKQSKKLAKPSGK